MFYVINHVMMFQVLGSAPCSHKEDDTRIILYFYAVKHVDIITAAIIVSLFNDIEEDKLWIAFWNCKRFRYESIPDLSNVLGIER